MDKVEFIIKGHSLAHYICPDGDVPGTVQRQAYVSRNNASSKLERG